MKACHPVGGIAAAVLLGAVSSLAGTTASSLVVKSPFLPPQFSPPGASGADAAVPAAPSQFEFRGVYQLNGRYYYHIFDHGSRKGQWLSQGMSGSGSPQIVSFIENRNLLVIEVNGEQLELEMQMLREPSILDQAGHHRTPPEPAVAGAKAGDAPPAHIRRPVIRPGTTPAPDAPSRRVLFQKPPTSQ